MNLLIISPKSVYVVEQKMLKYLFFYIDLEGKIYSDKFFESFYLDGKKNFFGDLLKKIADNQNFTFLNEQKPYIFLFSEAVRSQNANVIFSDAFDDVFIAKLVKIFKNINFNVQQQSLNFFILKNFLLKNPNFKGIAVVLSQFDETLNISVFEVDYDVRLTKKTALQIFDPLCFSITNNILDDVIKIYKTLSVEEREKQFLKLYRKVELRKQEFLQDELFTVSVPIENQRYIVNLKKEEILQNAELYSKRLIIQIKEFVDLPLTKIGKILVYGNLLKDTYFVANYENWLKKIEFVSLDSLPEILDKPLILKAEINHLNINDLEKGRIVKLEGFDPRPNKGKSLQVLEYLGDKRFKVIRSTRSLQPNDIAESMSDKWEINTQIDLKIYRNNEFFGIFRTRPIVKIEVE